MSWSRKYDRCQNPDCTTPESRHKGHGLCNACLQKANYARDPDRFRKRACQAYFRHYKQISERVASYRSVHREEAKKYCKVYAEKTKAERGVTRSARWFPGCHVIDSLLGRGVCVGRAKKLGKNEWFVPVQFPSGNVIQLPTKGLKRTGVWEQLAA